MSLSRSFLNKTACLFFAALANAFNIDTHLMNAIHFKSPLIPLFQRGISSYSPLWKRGVRGDLLTFILAFALAASAGCAGGASSQAKISAGQRNFLIAVLPVANLSGATAPAADLRQTLIKGLQEKGFGVLDEEALQGFMARRYVRYVAGIDEETCAAFKTELNVDAVMITTLELYSVRRPPKASVTSRLVSTEDRRSLWIDGKGLAGDDSPGILGLGLISDPRRLLDKIARSLVDSLCYGLSGQKQGSGAAGNRFQPKMAYRSPVFSPDMRYRVAVVPLQNQSGSRNAGDIIGLQFTRAMAGFRNFEVIEPGVVRDKLLRYRLILDQGVSLVNADTLFEVLQADLILTGTVFDYEDYQGAYGKPRVAFTVQLIERGSREVVWSSSSRNEGDDGVFFFDAGRINTAQAMASRMARLAVQEMVEK